MKINNFDTVIDTRATRFKDAVIKQGVVEVTFKDGNINLKLNQATIRDNNKQAIADIERVLHKYIGEPITSDACKSIADELVDISNKLMKEYD